MASNTCGSCNNNRGSPSLNQILLPPPPPPPSGGGSDPNQGGGGQNTTAPPPGQGSSATAGTSSGFGFSGATSTFSGPTCQGNCQDKTCNKCYVIVSCEQGDCKRCYRKNPNPNALASEILFKYHDAVVAIQSMFTLTDSSSGDPEETKDYFLSGNGFFVQQGIIVCPASLVLIPSSYLSDRNRYPYVSNTQPDPTGDVPNVMTQVSRILVTVYGVDSQCDSYAYTATLVMVDGASNIAYLKINMASASNKGAVGLKKCHPYFNWGFSKNCNQGDRVFSIGSFISNVNGPYDASSKNLITQGVISDNSHVDYQGWAQTELMVVDFETYYSKIGSPIINTEGNVVGMITGNVTGFVDPTDLRKTGQGAVFGVTELAMNYSFLTLLNIKDSKFAPYFQTIPDNLGTFYRYLKGYLGVAWDLVTAKTMFSTVAADGTVSINYTSGALSSGSFNKNIVGIRVAALAGSTQTTNPVIPGATTGAPYTPPASSNSPLLNIVNPNDFITHISVGSCNKSYAIGDLYNQICPTLITFAQAAGETVTLTYYTIADNYTNQNEITATLQPFPLIADYPWYAVDNLPADATLTRLPDVAFKPSF